MYRYMACTDVVVDAAASSSCVRHDSGRQQEEEIKSQVSIVLILNAEIKSKKGMYCLV